MKYLLDYVKEHKNDSFDKLPFNEVDGGLFAIMALIDVDNDIPKIGEEKITFEHVILKQIEKHGLAQFGFILSPAITRVFDFAKDTKRFKDLLVGDASVLIDEDLQTQSTYFSIFLPNNTRIMVCGSTDDSIVGWKEDFNLIFDSNVPCLENGVKYLNKVGSLDNNNIIVIGHSKGGMESLYACAYCSRDIYKRIINAYSFDGPGYSPEIIGNDKFIYSMEKMKLYVPNGGTVGRMFFNPIEPIILNSKYRGLNQHDVLSWEVDGIQFKRMKKFNDESNALILKLNKILSDMTLEEKKEFVKNVFTIFEAGGAKTLTELGNKPYRAIAEYVKLPEEKRILITSLIKQLANDKVIAKELMMGFVTIPTTK